MSTRGLDLTSRRRLTLAVRVALFVGGFILAGATTALAYWTVSVVYAGGNHALAQANSLSAPTAPTATETGAVQITVGWTLPSTQLAGAQYKVTRTSGVGSPATVCTVASTVTSCPDSGLTPATTYGHSVVAVLNNWQTTPITTSATTLGVSTSSLPGGVLGSPYSTTLTPTGGSGTYTHWALSSGTLPSWATLGSSTGAITGTPSAAGTTSGLQFTVTDSLGFTATSGALSLTVPRANQTITFTSTAPSNAAISGTYTPTATATSGLTVALTIDSSSSSVCSISAGVVSFTTAGTCTINANQAGNTNYNAAPQVQQSVTVYAGRLVFTTGAVSGSSSATPNLGPITVQRQNGAGTPITTGTLTVTGASSPPSATFGASQFGAPQTPTAPISAPSSTVTFWYGQTATGTATITISATNYASASQNETITTAPAGLGMALATGSTGTPVLACGAVSVSYTCNVTGVGKPSGQVVFYTQFLNSSGTPVTYSSTQPSTITETGQNTGTATILAGASSSSPSTLTASHTGNSTKTSTLTFGPYTLTINVSS
jgi:large repetitive protein